MYKVEDFVIAIYCLIEDELYPAFCQEHGLPRRAGFPPVLSDSECLTVELVGQYLGCTSQKQLYEQMHDRWSTWFPALKDRVAFGRQCAPPLAGQSLAASPPRRAVGGRSGSLPNH